MSRTAVFPVLVATALARTHGELDFRRLQDDTAAVMSVFAERISTLEAALDEIAMTETTSGACASNSWALCCDIARRALEESS